MKDYDSKIITYLDMNKLYLTYGGYKWFKSVGGFDVNSISKKVQ